MSRPARFLRQCSFALPFVLASASDVTLAVAQSVPMPTAVKQPTTAVAPLSAASSAVQSLSPAAGAPIRRAAAAEQPTPHRSASGRWVALDVGHVPGGGSRSASGEAEHNFNLRFAAALEAKLKQHGVAVRRLPTSLSLADRARHAQGAELVVSVHHDGPAVVGVAKVAGHGASAPKLMQVSNNSGFQLRLGHAEPLACARAVATQLQMAGRHFNTGGTGRWADKTLGVREGGEGALLNQADVPVMQLSLADIANPAEERLAGNAAWLDRQASAVATGLDQCVHNRLGHPARSLLPTGGASAARRA